MCLRVLPECMYMYHKDAYYLQMSKEAAGASATLHFCVLKEGLSLNLKPTLIWRSQQAPRMSLPNPNPGVIHINCHARLLCGAGESGLRSLHGKHFTHRAISAEYHVLAYLISSILPFFLLLSWNSPCRPIWP